MFRLFTGAVHCAPHFGSDRRDIVARLQRCTDRCDRQRRRNLLQLVRY